MDMGVLVPERGEVGVAMTHNGLIGRIARGRTAGAGPVETIEGEIVFVEIEPKWREYIDIWIVDKVEHRIRKLDRYGLVVLPRGHEGPLR